MKDRRYPAELGAEAGRQLLERGYSGSPLIVGFFCLPVSGSTSGIFTYVLVTLEAVAV